MYNREEYNPQYDPSYRLFQGGAVGAAPKAWYEQELRESACISKSCGTQWAGG